MVESGRDDSDAIDDDVDEPEAGEDCSGDEDAEFDDDETPNIDELVKLARYRDFTSPILLVLRDWCEV